MRIMEISNLLKKFVEIYKEVADVNLDRSLKPDLPSFVDKDKASTAHFFLLAASIDETRIIGRAENVRILLNHLYYKCLQENLFRIVDAYQFENELTKIKASEFYNHLGSEKKSIAGILAAVNQFVHDEVPNRDLTRYSENFATPRELAEELTTKMEARGIHFREKSWIYLRWMIRSFPDLNLFKSLRSKDLLMPLTTPTLRVAVALNLIDDKRVAERLKLGEEIDNSWWGDVRAVEDARREVTYYSKQQLGFADDPVKADYPFFVLGRWLSGLTLNEQELERSLRLFIKIYEQTNMAPIKYPVMRFYDKEHFLRYKRSRNIEIPYKGDLEPKVAQKLAEKGIFFEYEPLEFRLPLLQSQRPTQNRVRHITHTPDFILPRIKIHGKRVDLEPHWFWKKEDAYRFLKFREIYGGYFTLVLIADELPKYVREGAQYDYHWFANPKYAGYFGDKLNKLKSE